MAKFQTTPTKAPLGAAEKLAAVRAVFGEAPADALLPLKCACDALQWAEALFRAIQVVSEHGGGFRESDARHLASLGAYLTSDLGNHYGSLHEKMQASLVAVEDEARRQV